MMVCLIYVGYSLMVHTFGLTGLLHATLLLWVIHVDLDLRLLHRLAGMLTYHCTSGHPRYAAIGKGSLQG